MLTSLWNFHSLPCASHALQVKYPFLLAVYSYRPVPKYSAAFCAAFWRVMLLPSISTPKVWFFMFSIWILVLSFMVLISFAFRFVVFPFGMCILPSGADYSKLIRDHNVHKDSGGHRAKDCVSYATENR